MNYQLRNFQPGSIVIADYPNVTTGEMGKGLFFVFYDEGLDMSNGTNGQNILTFKITSNPNQALNHSFVLTLDDVPFLKFESYVLTTKPHTVHKNSVSSIVGVVKNNVLKDFFYLTFSKSLLHYSEQVIKKIKGEI